MIRYWIAARTEEGWTEWKQVSKKWYERAKAKPDYRTKTTSHGGAGEK